MKNKTKRTNKNEKNLDSGVVLHTFNLSTPETKGGGSMSSRPAWSTEQVPEQLSLGNEENHREQKAGEDVTEQESHVPCPVSSRIWQLQSCGSGVKEKRKRLWNLPL